MKFPYIHIKATNIVLHSHMEALLDQKFASLGKFIEEASDTKCEVELEMLTAHTSGKIYRAEVNLFMQGKLFRAEAEEEQIEQAIDTIRNELRRELQHAHNKRRSLVRRGSQAIKNMLRFGRK